MNELSKLKMRFTYEFENKEELKLSDHLSIERTKLSNQRTLFSYVRTSLYLVTAGIGLVELKTFEHLKVLGYISLGFSGVLFFIGLIQYFYMRRRLNSYIKPKMEIKK